MREGEKGGRVREKVGKVVNRKVRGGREGEKRERLHREVG